MRRAALIVFFSLACLSCFADEGILIVTEEWAPYNYSDNGNVIGVSTEIVRAIMRTIGEAYPIEMYPSIRAKRILDTRPKTIFYSLFRTPEREKSYRWVGPIIEESIYFYKRKGSALAIATLEDTKEVGSISCRRAGLIHDLLVERGYVNLDYSGTDSKQVYRKLLAKRCDLAISDTDIGVKYLFGLMNESTAAIEKVLPAFYTSRLYIALSKDISEEEYGTWIAAFERLRQSGELDAIIQRYY